MSQVDKAVALLKSNDGIDNRNGVALIINAAATGWQHFPFNICSNPQSFKCPRHPQSRLHCSHCQMYELNQRRSQNEMLLGNQ